MASHKKLNVLVFADWYLPGYKAGGPIRSVANLIARVDHHFSIVTSDRDLFATEPYADVTIGKWTMGKHGEKILYLDPSDRNKVRMTEILQSGDFDRIYFNSLFSPSFTLLPLRIARKLGMTSKIILAPRGMLKSGALSQKSFKKKIFLAVSKALGWFKGIRWHATSDEEKEEIASFFPGSEIRQAPNLILPVDRNDSNIQKRPGELRLITIARISPEKNIHGALEFLSQVDIKSEDAVVWDIYGTQQNPEYLSKCESIASGINARINLKGEIEHRKISNELNKAHFFFLATLGENYGHAIVESFLNAIPVIISNRTPWTDLENKNAGWDCDLNSTRFAEVLERCLRMDNKEYQELAEGSRTMGNNIADNEKDLQLNYELFDLE